MARWQVLSFTARTTISLTVQDSAESLNMVKFENFKYLCRCQKGLNHTYCTNQKVNWHSEFIFYITISYCFSPGSAWLRLEFGLQHAGGPFFSLLDLLLCQPSPRRAALLRPQKPCCQLGRDIYSLQPIQQFLPPCSRVTGLCHQYHQTLRIILIILTSNQCCGAKLIYFRLRFRLFPFFGSCSGSSCISSPILPQCIITVVTYKKSKSVFPHKRTITNFFWHLPDTAEHSALSEMVLSLSQRADIF